MSESRVQVLYVPARGDVAELRALDAVPPNDLTGLVGGWLEEIALGSGVTLCRDGEAHILRLRFNSAATALAHQLGFSDSDSLLGNAVFLGHGRDSTRADVPPWLVDQAASLVAVHRSPA